MAHKLDNLYEGRPIFVVATGTSLRGFDLARLNGKIAIGINRVVEYIYPTIVHFVDRTAHRTHAAALRDYNGMIIAGEGAAPSGTHDNTFEIRRNVETFEPRGDARASATRVGRSFSDGWFGGGAGCTALHTAVLLGGDPVYLLGYDFYDDNGRHFDEYDETRNGEDFPSVSMAGIEHISREEWIPRVYNCNPRSRLKCFPYLNVDEVLPHRG